MAQSASHSEPESFQHQPTPSCSCPIHDHGQPFTAPFGIRFADHVDVDPISRETASAVYEAHHSYMDSLPSVNIAHHGVYFQGALVGAITWRYPLISRKRIRYGVAGQLHPEPLDIDPLPKRLRPTARRILLSTDEPVVDSEVVAGDTIVEAARICIGVRMPNLASAALARAQERFVRDHADEDVRFLLTWVRADFDGAMVRALRDKGWTCTGYREPGQASNREDKPIRERYKWRFLCPVENIREQSTLDRWSQ
ncbi:hypothetical protein [Haloarcula salinisoli]|uniref:Uncharacterized protein n=1 Tax=Haloarcula salinisoli TaxID=2487746 RepID=A0A8J7YM59_9EURY|nr:hypothetical protein [Halomicroarcula salinisoli]MBX0288573.1 hypothetical protein [Halomicroarcula salinisoli]MBX0305754.1 hypothetical protein [Halomicroarcula salinisoli]